MNDALTPQMDAGRSSGAPRRLVRTPDGKIAGVAAGIGHYLGIDPTIVRIAFLVLVFAGGVGLLLYIACWIVMPKGEVEQAHTATSVDPWTAVGIVGLIAGVGLLVGWHGIGDAGRVAIAVALVVGGVLLIGRKTGGGDAPGGGGATSTPVAPLAPTPSPDEETVVGGDATPPAAADADGEADASVTTPEGEAANAASPPERIRAPLTALVVGVLAVGLALALAGALDGRFDVTWSTVLAAGLVVVGVGLAVAAATGGAPWLFAVGVVVMLGLTTAAVVEPIADRGIGQRLHTPLVATELEPEYRLGVGELRVDLSDLDLAGATRAIEVRLGIGKAEIVVPPGVTVDLNGHIGAGRLEAPDGSVADGIDRDLDTVVTGVVGAGTVVLDLEVGMGEGVVRHG